jgi:sarcosine oxidase gamma subunit
MVLDKIAGKSAERLIKHGMKTLLDMKMITASEISAIMADKKFRVSESTLRDWRAKAEQANQGSTPARIRKHHRENDNRYLLRYGPDLWMTKIRQCSASSGYRCFTEMIDHIDNETKRVRKGTKNE